MRILLIRHGLTDWNINDKVQGSSDIPLNETGIQQAYETKKILDNYEFDVVISSPLGRAVHTANIVCEDRDNEILIDERLKERDFGKFEGISYRKNMEYRKGAWSLKMEEQLDTVEAYPLFYERISGFLDDILNKYYDKNILLVAHGGVSIAVGHYLKGVPQNGVVHDYILDNCAVAEYDEEIIKAKI